MDNVMRNTLALLGIENPVQFYLQQYADKAIIPNGFQFEFTGWNQRAPLWGNLESARLAIGAKNLKEISPGFWYEHDDEGQIIRGQSVQEMQFYDNDNKVVLNPDGSKLIRYQTRDL